MFENYSCFSKNSIAPILMLFIIHKFNTIYLRDAAVHPTSYLKLKSSTVKFSLDLKINFSNFKLFYFCGFIWGLTYLIWFSPYSSIFSFKFKNLVCQSISIVNFLYYFIFCSLKQRPNRNTSIPIFGKMWWLFLDSHTSNFSLW